MIAVGLDRFEDSLIGWIHAAEAAAMENVRSEQAEYSLQAFLASPLPRT
jgi:hypothetical protein